MDKISDIKLQIITEIQKEPRHIRELEKVLKIPKSTISDKLKELYGQNIVDFKEFGRNKQFFLKSSFDSINYQILVEQYKVNQLFEKYPRIKVIIKEILDVTKEEMVIIFGSYAKLTATEKSDIDIFVNTNSKKLKEEIEQINSKVSVKIGDINLKSILNNEILRYGIALQNASYFLKVKNG